MALTCFASHGVDTNAIKMWNDMLQHQQHFIKTAYGESEGSYSNSTDATIGGPGQGSRGGPAACSVSTSNALFAMDKLAHGSSFCDTRQRLILTIKAAMYLDDNTNYSNDFLPWLEHPPTVHENLRRLQHDAQVWERLLWATGGLLKLPKCLFYLIHWTFNAEGVPRMMKTAELPPLRLTSGNNQEAREIKQLDFDMPHRTLGCRVTPGFNPEKSSQAQKTAATHATYLQKKADAFATSMATNPLSADEATTSYYSIFQAQMTFGLGVCPISKTKLEKIQRKSKIATLQKMGFMRSTPNAVTYGALQYGGLGLRNLYVERGIAQLILVIRHVRAMSDQGVLCLIAIDWWQQSAGLDFSLLVQPTMKIPYLADCWLTRLRDFLAFINGTLQISDQQYDLPPRRGDTAIMSAILSSGATRAEMIKFNRCREYLQVKWLAEITTADGTSLTRDAWTGDRTRHTSELWPVQPKPGPKHWTTWRRLLGNTFLQTSRNT